MGAARLRPLLFLLGLSIALTGSASTGGSADRLLFVSTRDGNAQIYVMQADGSHPKALTRGPAENTDPAWSPDGRRIAFTSYRDGNAEIYVMNADGSHVSCLTDHPLADNAPTWTADGRIVFRSMRDGHSELYLMDAHGGNLSRLTNSRLDKGQPLISPDGSRIAFIGIDPADMSQQVYLLPITGGEPQRLTAGKETKFSPAWSPDGKRIAYVERKGNYLSIWVAEVDTGRSVKITDTPKFNNTHPVWSPDGRRIAFVSSRDGGAMDQARGDIYVMDADGSNVVNLTRDPEEDNYPVWSADGSRIYFVSLRDGYAQIYSVRPDGSEQQRVTWSVGSDLRVTPLSQRKAQRDQLADTTPPTNPSLH